MSEATICDGPKCHEVKVEKSSWIELVEDSVMYDFHNSDCLENWLTGYPDEEVPEDQQREVTVTLRGRIVGRNSDLGYLFLQGCDAKSGHPPWLYRLHWATETEPVA